MDVFVLFSVLDQSLPAPGGCLLYLLQGAHLEPLLLSSPAWIRPLPVCALTAPVVSIISSIVM